MSDRTPILVGAAEPQGKRPRPAASGQLSPLVPFMMIGGLVLSVSGWVDVLLFYYPPRFGEAEWEFGIIAQTYDALPLPTVAFVLLALAARITGGQGMARALSVAAAVVSLVLLGLLVIFALDVPVAFQALERAASLAQQQGAQANPLLSSGLKRLVAKALLFGTSYALAWGAMSVLLWRGHRAAGIQVQATA